MNYISTLRDDLYNNKIDETYFNKIFSILSQLTSSPILEYRDFINIISNLDKNHDIFVYKIQDQPVALITLFIEQKLIHGGKSVGHIEDLVVDKQFRNQKIGKKLLEYIIQICSNYNCYKVLLDCNDSMCSDFTIEDYYKKQGFIRNGLSMRYNII